jgi:hypothetical protein
METEHKKHKAEHKKHKKNSENSFFVLLAFRLVLFVHCPPVSATSGFLPGIHLHLFDQTGDQRSPLRQGLNVYPFV